MLCTLLQSHYAEQFHSLLFGLFSFASCYQSRNYYVLQGCELRKQLVELEYKSDMLVAEGGKFPAAHPAKLFSVEVYAAAVGLVKCSYKLQQGCLSGSARSYDAYDLAPVDFQVYFL